jgi:hypothetical protein
MFVSDLRHFLDLDEDTPGPARRMAERLSMIVRAATAGDLGEAWVSALRCERRPGRQRCPGQIAVRRTDAPPSIAWQCMSCGDDGVISGWEGSPHDLRPERLVAVPVARYRIVVPLDVAATLRDIQVLDRDVERLVFRARASEAGAVLIGDEAELEELLGCVAAEANDEDNRRRRRNLDEAFEGLTRAVEESAGG